MKEFSERLRTIQKERDISQHTMAEMTGITATSISAYINDRKTPALDVAVKIAKTFGVSMDWLCGGDTATKTIKLNTYEDLFKMLVAVADGSGIGFAINAFDSKNYKSHAFFRSPAEEEAYFALMEGQSSHSAAMRSPRSVKYAAVETIDPKTNDFVSGWKRVRALYLDGTIDREMYDAWLEKRFRDAADIPLCSASGTESKKNQPEI